MKSKQELAGIIQQKREAVLIVNTRSRKGEKLFQRAQDLLQSGGIDVVASYPIRKPEQLKEILRQVIEEGHTLIIVGGGDGTFNTVIDLFVHRDLVLGLLPLGTANNFARSMGIPMNLEGAVDAIVQGKMVEADIAMINDQYFINVASVGFSRETITATPDFMKRYLGIVTYFLYEIKYLISQRLFRCTINMETETKVIYTRQVLIMANGSFYGTRKFCPDDHVDNGTLSIYLMDSLSRWQGLKFWFGFYFGRHLTYPESRLYTTESTIIETEPPRYAIIGDEKTIRTPIRVTIDPAAVKIMAPDSFHDYDEST
ncbi:diacylglycerol/lipid kinase family protein [Methanosphaerula subterraneus]|uniref:diacylglycerol/lipid kinase family protein n=1 Tax=Methanosphaerula subterraneus TaxID=3350244 RepID=UPI003F83549B